jgi:hypothetical protein
MMAWKYGSDSSLTAADALVRGIGLFSLGLGVAELVAPGKIARTFGLEGKENIVRAFGAREIAGGVGTLSINPQPALWARFAGDLMDAATVALGTRSDDEEKRRNAWIGVGAAVGFAALDAFAATLMAKRGGERPPPADYSDRSGLPKGVEASRGYYREKREKGPAVASRDARKDRTHSSDSDPARTETDAGQAPIPAGVSIG